jgi:hypothetical protein
MMRALVAMLLVTGCGDNTYALGPPLARADHLFFAAHADDAMIFMQPQLLDALRAGSSTTVYFTHGDPVKGYDRAVEQLAATKTAYGAILGRPVWDCGYIAQGIQHCRNLGADVSIVAVDLPDGGIPGDGRESLLHLVDGSVDELSFVGPTGGTATVDSTIDIATTILAETAPRSIDTLELAGTHGRDHSSHMFSASFLLWAMARTGYIGPVTWHRGYNVDVAPVTLDGDAYAGPAQLLGYYEACADKCAPCGTACATLLQAHATWLQRQHATSRRFELAPDGHLRVGDLCLASHDDDRVTSEPCGDVAEQYWVEDADGILWNGLPPRAEGDMTYDHVRCLVETDGMLSAPTCGAHRTQAWATAPRTP